MAEWEDPPSGLIALGGSGFDESVVHLYGSSRPGPRGLDVPGDRDDQELEDDDFFDDDDEDDEDDFPDGDSDEEDDDFFDDDDDDDDDQVLD